MLKTKIVRRDAYIRLLKAKGFCTESQKGVLSLYFDSFSPPNAKRSKMKTFLKVSLVLLFFRLCTAFYVFEKMTVISLCWFAMKNGISVVHLTTFQTKISATCSVEQIATFQGTLIKFENLPICLWLYKNNTLKISLFQY